MLLSVCVCVCVYGETRGSWKCWLPLELELYGAVSCLLWVLGDRTQVLWRSIHSPNHRAISLATRRVTFLSPVCIQETSSESCVWIGSLCPTLPACSLSVLILALLLCRSLCFLHTIEQELYPLEAGMLGPGGRVSVISKLQHQIT